MSKMIVSPSPHIHSPQSTTTLMRDVIIALAPAAVVSILYYGWSALMLLAVSVVSCVAFEYVIAKYLLKRKATICDLSAVVTGVLLALNLPVAAPWWIAVVGALVAIGIAKMTFGGLGQNIFNPALVARVFLLISFPVIMTDWSATAGFIGADAFTGATPLALAKAGEALPNAMDMLFVSMGGSAGEISCIALLAGFVYLLVRKVIRPHITLSIWITVILFSGLFHVINPEAYTGPMFNLLTGGMLLGSIFMATDYVTSPMNIKGQIIFGVGIGLITMCIRYFGAYPEGVSFAILIMNCAVPLLNKIQPKRFGRASK
jgi:electron transport complex protein RnfD